MLDPVALEILNRLVLAPQTSGELAGLLAVNPVEVRKRLTSLSGTGQVRRLGTTRRRRRAEYLYTVDLQANLLTTEDLEGVPQRIIDEAELSGLRLMFREIAAANETGSLTSRTEYCATRFPLTVGEGEVRAILDLHLELLSSVIAEASAARRRLEEGSSDRIFASAHVLLFHHPADRRTRPPAESPQSRRSPSGREDQLPPTDSLEAAVVEVVAEGRASAAEVSEILGISGSKARYELQRLLGRRWVRVAETRPRRGTVERIFEIDYRHLIDHPDGARAPRTADWIVRRVYGEAVESIRHRDRRTIDDIVTAWIPMSVDAQGFAAISARMEAVLERLIDFAEGKSQPRSDLSPGRMTVSGLFLFEMAPREHGPR